MRIAIAEISQETDTFSPVLTGLIEFEQNGLFFGDEILGKMQGVGTLGGFLTLSGARRDLQLVPLLRAQAMPSGRLTAATFDFLKERLVVGLERELPVDGVFLSLHGAASAQQADDVEGQLLHAVRQVVGPQVPVVAALDHHANITKLMMASADLVVGFQTQPHDPVETGERAARLLFDLVAGKFSPACGWYKIPMVTPQDQFLTSGGPMKVWFDLARDLERHPGVISASTFPMQPWVDVEEAGWAAVVYTDGDLRLAWTLAAELANKAWELRGDFWLSERVPPAEAVRQADQAPQGLIILADTGDSIYGGAPGDSTCLLKEMLEQKFASTAYVPVVDPEAVERAMKAGEGRKVTLSLGGKMDRVFGRPVQVTGIVKRISQGLILELGGTGQLDMGKTVLLEAGTIKIALADSRLQAINYPAMYTHLGLEIAQAKMVVLKTASNFQYFAPWRRGLIRVDSPGMTQSDLHAFDWVRIPRPLYPFDDLPAWRAQPPPPACQGRSG
jgi:microcystin degradation protein MlrC